MSRSGRRRRPIRRPRTRSSERADETAPCRVQRTHLAGRGPTLGKVSRAGDLHRPGGRGHLVRRSSGPTAGGTGTSLGSSAGFVCDSRVHRAARPAPVGANALLPQAAATAGTPTPPESIGAPSALAATSTGVRFDIVVASFRTDGRAASVASRSRGARAADPPTRLRRLAAGGLRAVRLPQVTPRKRSNVSAPPASPARRLCRSFDDGTTRRVQVVRSTLAAIRRSVTNVCCRALQSDAQFRSSSSRSPPGSTERQRFNGV